MKIDELLFHYFLMLSVPSFILISLYFFYKKLAESSDYWKIRFLRLFQIYVFWVGIQFILYLILGGELPLPLKTIFRSGGPNLPWVSFLAPFPSIFYYLYALIVCTVLAFLFVKLPEKIKLVVLIVVVGATCVYFIIASIDGKTIDTRSMRNWYAYIPVAYYLYRYKDKFIQFRWFFLAGFIIAVVFEYMYGHRMSAFGRLSVFLETLTAVSFCLSGWRSISKPTALLSRYSLGLYALHPLFMGILILCVTLFWGQEAYPPQMLYQGVLLFVVTLALTFLGTWLMSKTRFRMYVM